MKKTKNNSFYKILIIATGILIILNILFFYIKVIVPNNKKKDTILRYEQYYSGELEISSLGDLSKTEEEIKKEEIDKLKTMTEKERIKTYLVKYLMHIESQEYEQAYNLLYPDFKENYFEEINKYKNYVNKLYPDTIILQYGNMERQGYYFIISVDIIDPTAEKSAFSMKYIVYEKDYNDFIISFEVK